MGGVAMLIRCARCGSEVDDARNVIVRVNVEVEEIESSRTQYYSQKELCCPRCREECEGLVRLPILEKRHY